MSAVSAPVFSLLYKCLLKWYICLCYSNVCCLCSSVLSLVEVSAKVIHFSLLFQCLLPLLQCSLLYKCLLKWYISLCYSSVCCYCSNVLSLVQVFFTPMCYYLWLSGISLSFCLSNHERSMLHRSTLLVCVRLLPCWHPVSRISGYDSRWCCLLCVPMLMLCLLC